jgi:hypothetical protein
MKKTKPIKFRSNAEGLNVLLTTEQLAQRWAIKPETLEAWRAEGRGPAFLKLGGTSQKSPVRYRLADILKFESESVVETN